MIFDFSKLRGLIKEQFGSEKAFAEAMNVTTRWLSVRLNNKIQFDGDEIYSVAKLLNIPDNEIGTYFFKLKFDKIEQEGV